MRGDHLPLVTAHVADMTSEALPRLQPLRLPVALRPNLTVVLAATFVLSLAGSVAVSVTQLQEQAEHTKVVSDLEYTVGALTSAVTDAQSSTRLKMNQISEYRSLMLEQDAAFESTDGFIQ